MVSILQECVVSLSEGQKRPDGVEMVDCHMQVAVDVRKAQEHRDELKKLLNEWPSEAWGEPITRLEEGPNYLQVGAVLDDQIFAFMLFAVGKVLGFWEVITPKSLGFEGDEAGRMAGGGYVMIHGYRPG